jgi:micrococcal nuclease
MRKWDPLRATQFVRASCFLHLSFQQPSQWPYWRRWPPRPQLSEPETGRVAAILDGETLKLNDGRTVRLIGAKAPSPPLGWRGDDPWPLVEEAKQTLDTLAAGKAVELKYGGGRTDRYGRALAQVFVVSGKERVWLQEELVAKGLARVYSSPTIAPVSPSF